MHDEVGVWTPSRRRLTTGLVLTVTLVAFESLAVSAVMPDVKADLGGLDLYGWVFSGFFLGSLLGIVLAGQAVDRRPPAVAFTVGLVLFALGLLGAGAAPSMGVLVAARVAQGVGAGAIPAVAYTAVGRAYPKTVQPRLFAVFSTAWVVPGLIGPATATGIAHAASWRWVFLGLLPLVAVAAAIAIPALATATHTPTADDEPAEAGDRRRVAHAGVLIVGAAAVLGGLTGGSIPAAVVLLLAGTPLAAWAFVRLVPPGTARFAAGLPAAVGVRGVLTFAFFGTDAFVPLALTDVRDQPGWVAGMALTVATLTWTAAAWVQQRVVHRVGPRRLVRSGFGILAVGIAGAIACLGALPVPLAIVLWGAAGFGIGLSYAPLSVTVLSTARPGQEGRATSGLQLSDVLGVSLGTGLTGVFLATGESLDWATRTSLTLAFGLTTAVALVGTVLARRLPAEL